MKITDRKALREFVIYTFSNKAQYVVKQDGYEFGTTATGRAVTHDQLRTMCKLASQFEDNRVQIRD